MKKLIALVAVAALFVAFSISTVGKKLPSVGYVLVGPINDGGWFAVAILSLLLLLGLMLIPGFL